MGLVQTTKLTDEYHHPMHLQVFQTAYTFDKIQSLPNTNGDEYFEKIQI